MNDDPWPQSPDDPIGWPDDKIDPDADMERLAAQEAEARGWTSLSDEPYKVVPDGHDPADADLLEPDADILERLAAQEADAGLEYVGPGSGQNRAQRRQLKRDLQRMTRRPDGCRTMLHPLLETITPRGVVVMRKRRAAARMARATRKEQQRAGAHVRRQRQKRNLRSHA